MKRNLFFVLFLLLAVAAQAQNNKAGDLTLTIRYLYAADSTMAAHKYVADTLSEGDLYCVPSPVVEGFLPDRDTVQGKMPAKNVTDTVFYSRNAFAVIVSPDIEHGTVEVSPEGDVTVGATVTLTAIPDEFYELEEIKVFNKADETQTVELDDNTFVMPAFDVMVTAFFELGLPVIEEDIDTPEPICAGEALELTAPEVSNADEEGWQMAAESSFEDPEAYEGQTLDATYNGWKLRYFASNDEGTVYSNTVSIKVRTLAPVLVGDASLCTMQTGTYTVSSIGNSDLTWTVSDANATVVESGKILKVTWATAGEHTVSVLVENIDTGCSATVSVNTTVTSFVTPSEVQTLVAKKNSEGREYLLIYPNPQDTYKYQWYKDGNAINGANGQYYYKANGLDAGVYQLYISFNADANGNLFGGAFTDAYTVAATSKPMLSPNPAQPGHGILVVNEGGEEAKVSIFSIDGRLLHQQVIQGTQSVLEVNLPQGIYLVRFTDAQNIETTEKLMIQ